jgi:hypothetical protein
LKKVVAEMVPVYETEDEGPVGWWVYQKKLPTKHATMIPIVRVRHARGTFDMA